MSDVLYSEWMSGSDSVLWHIERDPLLRSTITSVWFLDSVPDRARLDAVVQRIVTRIPRLHQRVVDAQAGIAPPRWVEDPHVDLDYHYTWARLPGRRTDRGTGRRDVLDYAQRLAARSFDRDRPLWELYVVDGLPGKRAALVMKVHHAIADGLGMVQLLQYMVDLEADPAVGAEHRQVVASEPAAEPARPRVEAQMLAIPGARSIAHRLATDARTGVRLGRASLRTAGDLLRNPRGTIEQLGRTTGSVARVIRPAMTPMSPVMTDRSLNIRFDAITVPFSAFKGAARAVDATLNDVFVAITLDALRRYHDALAGPCARIRMNMPVSVRGGAGANVLDNQFVPARIVLPLSDLDPAERIREVRELLRALRAEPALPHVNDISDVISRFGPTAAVTILGALLKGVDITTSNVPGPPFPVYMAGARVEEFYGFGPLAGSALNITLFSYNHSVYLGVNTDRAAIVDHELFVDCLNAAIDDTVALSRSA